MSVIPNVLAERYASAAMKSIWSAEGRIILEREFLDCRDESPEGSGAGYSGRGD